jgi:hypothetical protein
MRWFFKINEEKSEGPITNGQSRDTDKTGCKTQKENKTTTTQHRKLERWETPTLPQILD